MPHSTLPSNTVNVNGNQIEIVPLETIDYGRLVSRDGGELEKLLAASQMPGFFYLDLRSEPQGFVSDLEAVYGLSQKHFDEPVEGGG